MGLLEIAIKQKQDEDALAREMAARQQAKSLIGAPSRQIDQGQPVQQVQDVDPATGQPYTYEKSVLPTSQAGTGYLGKMEGLLSPEQQAQANLYSGLIGTQGYENIGAQGLQGLIGEQREVEKLKAATGTKTAKDAFDQEQKIRNEFRNETKTFIDINDAYGRIQSSAVDPSPAGDLSMIFNYMKMLDPGSVVRESEFATAEGAASVPERLKGAYNKVISGRKLTPQQRADFTNRAGKLYNEALTGFGKRKATFEKLAESYSLDPTKATFTRGLYDPYVAPKGLIGQAEQPQAPALPPGFVRDK